MRSSLCLIIQHHYTLLQIPITLWFPIHPSRVFHWCSRMNAVRISGNIRPLLFRKNSCSKSFWKFAGKTSMAESFVSTRTGLRATFPESCLEQLFFREPFRGRFYKKKLPHRRYLKNFPDFLNHAREKAVVCSAAWKKLRHRTLPGNFPEFSSYYHKHLYEIWLYKFAFSSVAACTL